MTPSWSVGAGAPALPAALAFACGILLGALPAFAAAPLVVALAAVACALTAVGLSRDRRLAGAGALLIALLLGALSGRFRVLLPGERTARLAASLEGQTVEIEGRLDGPWAASGSRRRAPLVVERARAGQTALALEGPLTLAVSGSREPAEVADAGDRIRVRGELRMPDSGPRRSPFALAATPALLLKSAEQIDRLEGPDGLLAPIRRLHTLVTRRLRANLADASAGDRRALALATAMTLGETAELPPDASSAFLDGGVAHLLAISGLQLALVAALVAAALRNAPLSVGARDAGVLGAALFFAVFAGLSAPVVRAALMVAFYLGARLLGRPTTPWQVLALAALVLLAAEPRHLFEVGFLLTFGAVAALAAFGSPLARGLRDLGMKPRWLADAAGATLSAELAVLPIQALAFNTVPFGALLSNIVLIPLAGVFLVAALAALPLLLVPVLAPVAIVPIRILADAQLLTLEALESFRPLRFIPTPSFALAFSCAGALALAAAAKGRLRTAFLATGIALAIAIALRRASREPAGVLRLDAIDVGQGDAWLLSSSEGAVLVDGGGSVDPAYDFGRARLLPKLGDLGAVAFDAIFLTHPHPDHSRGLLSVLRLAPVERLALPRGAPRNPFLDEVLAAAARRGVPVLRLGAGERIEAGGFAFQVLHPGEDTYARSRENNGSLVLKTRLGARSLLLTGDVEGQAERDLLARGGDLGADILKVPHHGSRTSSSAPFLAAVAPRLAVVGVGRRNPFGHPAPDVLARLLGARIRLLRTDRDGDFSILAERGRLFPLLGMRLER